MKPSLHNIAAAVSYLTGPGSAGKSLLSQQLCTCIALGLSFIGLETRQAAALYVSCEDDADELHRRQKAVCDALGVPLETLSGRLHLVSLTGELGAELATFTAEGLKASQRYRALEGMAIAHDIGFVAIDNVAHVFAGNENVRNEVAAFMALLNRLAIRTSGAVLLLGHPNKSGDAFSGSTAWENQVRARMYLESPRDAEGNALDPDRRVLRLDKANYARNGAEVSFRWHHGAFVRDQDLPEDQAHEIAENVRAAADNAIFLTCLAERNRQMRAVSENNASRTYAPLEFAKMAESKRIGKARLEAALDRLFRLGKIERGLLWRSDGKDRFGLREKPAELAADVPLTSVADPRRVETPTPALSHPIPKGIEAAPAWEGGAPTGHDQVQVARPSDSS